MMSKKGETINMKKTLFLNLIFTILLFGCSPKTELPKKKSNSNINYISRIIIFHSDDAYFLEIDDSGNLNVSFGKMNEKFEMYEIIKEEKKELPKEIYTKIIMQKSEWDKLESFQTKSVIKGDWEVIIEASNKRIHIYRSELKKYKLDELFEEIIKNSPMKIDLHSWS